MGHSGGYSEHSILHLEASGFQCHFHQISPDVS